MTIRDGRSRLTRPAAGRIGARASPARVDVRAGDLPLGLLAATRSGTSAIAAFTNGLLIHPMAVAPASETLSTTLAAVDVTTAGIKFTLVFQRRAVRRESWPYQLRSRVRWEVVAPSGAGATGRVAVDLRVNGVAVTGLTRATGPTRVLTGAAVFTETNLVLAIADLAAPPVLRRGDTLDLRVEFEVVGTSVGASPDIRIYHDPADVGGRLALDTDYL